MHEIFALYSAWSSTIYSFARIAVGILLWFWVVSGVVFGLRFLAYFLMDKEAGTSPLAAAATLIPFPPFEQVSRQEDKAE